MHSVLAAFPPQPTFRVLHATVQVVSQGSGAGERGLTLGAHQHEGQLTGAAVAGHPAVVVVHRLEAGLVLEAEDEHDGVHPHGELQRERGEGRG